MGRISRAGLITVEWVRRSGAMAVAVLLCALSGAASQPSRTAFTLIGLDTAAVEKNIGPPDEKDDLADSDEAYWTYKTAYGTLAVHFQNHVVVSFTPEGFPLEKIRRRRGAGGVRDTGNERTVSPAPLP